MWRLRRPYQRGIPSRPKSMAIPTNCSLVKWYVCVCVCVFVGVCDYAKCHAVYLKRRQAYKAWLVLTLVFLIQRYSHVFVVFVTVVFSPCGCCFSVCTGSRKVASARVKYFYHPYRPCMTDHASMHPRVTGKMNCAIVAVKVYAIRRSVVRFGAAALPWDRSCLECNLPGSGDQVHCTALDKPFRSFWCWRWQFFCTVPPLILWRFNINHIQQKQCQQLFMWLRGLEWFLLYGTSSLYVALERHCVNDIKSPNTVARDAKIVAAPIGARVVSPPRCYVILGNMNIIREFVVPPLVIHLERRWLFRRGTRRDTCNKLFLLHGSSMVAAHWFGTPYV